MCAVVFEVGFLSVHTKRPQPIPSLLLKSGETRQKGEPVGIHGLDQSRSRTCKRQGECINGKER